MSAPGITINGELAYTGGLKNPSMKVLLPGSQIAAVAASGGLPLRAQSAYSLTS